MSNNIQHTMLRNEQPLTNAQLERYAPSIFAAQPYHAMSDSYAFIPTIDVVNRLRDEGFVPVEVRQSGSRIADKHGFAKHAIRFRDTRNGGLPITRNLGELYAELLLTNSHDGGSKYILDAGLFRLACYNGMVTSDSLVPSVSVAHRGDAAKVIEASWEVIDQMPKMIEAVDSMQRLQLTAPQATAFATAALQLRYNDGQAPVSAEQVIGVRRREDRENTLWNVFNRTQEALVGGGLRGRNAETGRRQRTRPVNGITENTKLNKALFTLATEMQKLLS